LQGQTTCDVASLKPGNSIFGALCNAKGRAISLFHLFKVGSVIYMLINTELADALSKRLKMFVFRSDVQITNISNSYKILGSASHPQEIVLAKLNPLAICKLHSTSDISLIVIETETNQKNLINKELKLDGNLTDWNLLNSTECFPEITADTSELFIPQMLNLDLLNGINFQKGCYTGQEVIARLHYKGSVKKRLVGFQSADPFKPGENIHLPEDANSIGTILSCTQVKCAEFSGLVVLKVDAIKPQELTLNDNRKLLIHPPKYSIE